MRKILETILELFGLDKAEIGWQIDLLSRHATLYVTLTALILLVTVIAPIMLTRPIGDWFDRKSKRRERRERVQDITVAAYHEMSSGFRGLLKAFPPDTTTVNVIVQKIGMDSSYCPIWTFDDSDMFVFENYVKKDIAIFPSQLIGTTVEYYQQATYFLAYMRDTRSDVITALPAARRADFFTGVYYAAYEYIGKGCLVLAAYEKWLSDGGAKDLSDLSWIADVTAFSADVDKHKLADFTERQRVYRLIADKYDRLATAIP